MNREMGVCKGMCACVKLKKMLSVEYLFPGSLKPVLPLSQQALSGAQEAAGLGGRLRRCQLRQVHGGRRGRRQRRRAPATLPVPSRQERWRLLEMLEMLLQLMLRVRLQRLLLREDGGRVGVLRRNRGPQRRQPVRQPAVHTRELAPRFVEPRYPLSSRRQRRDLSEGEYVLLRELRRRRGDVHLLLLLLLLRLQLSKVLLLLLLRGHAGSRRRLRRQPGLAHGLLLWLQRLWLVHLHLLLMLWLLLAGGRTARRRQRRAEGRVLVGRRRGRDGVHRGLTAEALLVGEREALVRRGAGDGRGRVGRLRRSGQGHRGSQAAGVLDRMVTIRANDGYRRRRLKRSRRGARPATAGRHRAGLRHLVRELRAASDAAGRGRG